MAGIFLNFFEVSLISDKTEVFVLPYKDYEDKDSFHSLIDSNSDYWFYRSGEDIFTWNHKNNTSSLDFKEIKQMTLKISEYPYIFCKMLELGIENFFNSRGNSRLYSRYGINAFLSKTNLTKDIDGLETYNLLLFRTFYTRKLDKLKIGFTLDFKLHHKFTWDKNKFIRNGIDIRGLELKDDNKTIAPNKVALKRFMESIGKYEAFEKIVEDSKSAETIYQLADKTFNFINENKDNIFLNEKLRIKKIVKINLPYGDGFFKSERFSTPSYYYDNQYTASGRASDILREKRPFSYQQFKNKQVKILVIASNKHQGNVEIFIKKLLSNLKTMFHLSNIKIIDKYFKSGNDILSEYKEVIYQNIDNADTEKIFDLVIPIIESDYKKLEIKSNPYFFSKAKLMGQGIPTQEITIEKIKALNEYILNNICLSVYAKISGTAWTIEKIEPLRNEIVVGIGSSVIREGTDSDKRVVGFATVFDYSGKYIVGDCSPVTTFDEYGEKLKAYLIETISKIINSRNISKEQEIRLIFHLYKSAGKKRELYATEKAIEAFKDYKIDFSLLHVGYGHNFKIYKNHGKDCPERGLIINLSDHQLLLNLANKLKGNPSPLSIRIDRRSTFKDLNYLAKQVFFFSFISFRSFIPSKKPITILYPSIMSKLTEEMKMIDGWDYEKLQYVGNKLWFL